MEPEALDLHKKLGDLIIRSVEALHAASESGEISEETFHIAAAPLTALLDVILADTRRIYGDLVAPLIVPTAERFTREDSGLREIKAKVERMLAEAEEE